MFVNKKTFVKAVLLSVAVSGTMVSCEKDEMVIPSHEMSQKNLAHINTTLRYWIDGVEYCQTFASPAERENFISYLVELTRGGRNIIIKGADNPDYAPEEKDKQTFTTSDKTEMKLWSDKMVNAGYKVEIYFDDKTGLYTGTATKGGSRTTMAVSLSESE